MTVCLSNCRLISVEQACADLIKRNVAKIRDVARVIGLMVSSFSAVDFDQQG